MPILNEFPHCLKNCKWQSLLHYEMLHTLPYLRMVKASQSESCGFPLQLKSYLKIQYFWAKVFCFFLLTTDEYEEFTAHQNDFKYSNVITFCIDFIVGESSNGNFLRKNFNVLINWKQINRLGWHCTHKCIQCTLRIAMLCPVL